MEYINLDIISANPLLPEVQDALIAAIKENYGNPSSAHQLGEKAAAQLDLARQRVAALINSPRPEEIIFCSGGTESINHAIKGVAFAKRDKGKHIITSNIEHNAVLKPLRGLRALGYDVTSVPVDKLGKVDPDEVSKAMREDTILVSIMHANNEIGTIQPIKEIAQVVKEYNATFHCDAVATVGVIPVDVQDVGVDLLSFSANQFYGPSGIGGLYIRRGTSLVPLVEGGSQERTRRGGTENLLGIIAMGVAAEAAKREMKSRIAHARKLKEKLLKGLEENVGDIIINGDPDNSLPNLVSASIRYIEGESIVLMLDEENIAASTKSACASGSLRASHVLVAIGADYADAQGTIVITFGRDTTDEDIDKFLEALSTSVRTLRSMSPLYRKEKMGN